MINIRHVPLTNTFNSMVKRSIDIFGALVAIILFSPIMLISAILVKTTSKGPLIFRQERVGLHNKPFYMYKFRSMAVQEIKDEKAAWTTKNDPRVTGIGKIMRKTSIDELPQLFNVLKGDMSLVGPRPERPQFVEKFREEIPRYMVKHQVRPGMTGWAQINGYRGDTSIKRRIEFDLYYIENWTVGLDIKILILTIFKGLYQQECILEGGFEMARKSKRESDDRRFDDREYRRDPYYRDDYRRQSRGNYRGEENRGYQQEEYRRDYGRQYDRRYEQGYRQDGYGRDGGYRQGYPGGGYDDRYYEQDDRRKRAAKKRRENGSRLLLKS